MSLFFRLRRTSAPACAQSLLVCLVAVSCHADVSQAQETPDDTWPAPPPAVIDETSPDTGRTRTPFTFSAAFEMIAPLGFENVPNANEHAHIRSAELILASPLGPLFDAVLDFGGHDDEYGSFRLGVHEGYIGSNRLIPMSRLRAGKFLLSVGHLNQSHPYEWPFIGPPRSHREFFSETNVSDTGLEYAIRWPSDIGFDLLFGVTQGFCYGDCHSPDAGEDEFLNEFAEPLAPTHYVHPVLLMFFADGARLQGGLTYLARVSSESEEMRLYGLDLTYKRFEGSLVRWLLLSEIYHRYLKPADFGAREQTGGYAYAERAFNETWSVGVRAEAFAEPELKDSLFYALAPVLSYRAGETSVFRMAYSYGTETQDDNSDRRIQTIELQFVAWFGSKTRPSFLGWGPR